MYLKFKQHFIWPLTFVGDDKLNDSAFCYCSSTDKKACSSGGTSVRHVQYPWCLRDYNGNSVVGTANENIK